MRTGAWKWRSGYDGYVKASQIKSSSKFILVVDTLNSSSTSLYMTVEYGLVGCCWPDTGFAVSSHGRVARSYLFVDGHVDAKNFSYDDWNWAGL
jgi:prepilin-type processing-associated H-X9-DG protein